jgi:glucokinase
MGHRGCLESLCSGAAIEREAKAPTREVLKRVRAGDKEALAIAEKAALFLATGLSLLDKEYHPELFILGGGMSEAKEFTDLIFDRIKNSKLRSKVKLAQLGEKAGLLGAGRLAFLGIEKR